MKNSLKAWLIALTVIITVSACERSPRNSHETKIDTVQKNADSLKAAVDKTKKDYSKK